MSAASPTVSNSVLTVGSGTGFDEEAVNRDLAIMEGVEKEDANTLRQWCEVRGLRDDIEKFPKDGKPSDLGDLFIELGHLLFDMGDEIGSEKAFREGIRRASAYAPCYASLASKLRGRNDLAGAERVLRKGIEKFPKDGKPSVLGELFSDLGDMLDNMGDAIGAEKVFREGTRRGPGNVFCITAVADKLVQRHDPQGAERVLRKGIKNFPKDGDLADRGSLFSFLGDMLDDMGDAIGAKKVKRDLEAIKKQRVEKEDARKVLRWCEKLSQKPK